MQSILKLLNIQLTDNKMKGASVKLLVINKLDLRFWMKLRIQLLICYMPIRQSLKMLKVAVIKFWFMKIMKHKTVVIRILIWKTPSLCLKVPLV
ncbi:MAG: hypothetical protein COA50_11105 [Flavobacteriaceae bacterium]|nr:MAG: hypothetical protein COA50_11105 [Flavobacteriaceae bacterium]